MSETLIFERREEPSFEGEDVRIEKLGVNKFRLYTGGVQDFDFRNRMKMDRFNSNFIGALNAQLDDGMQLDVRDRDVERALMDVHKSLERDSHTIKFKITFRMQN